jgi:hypothetical protein
LDKKNETIYIVPKEIVSNFNDSKLYISNYFDLVRKEVMEAYGDENPNMHFVASYPLSRNEVIKIMGEFVPEYNNFEPKLLNHLPEDRQIIIARSYSPCFWVLGDEMDQKLQKKMLVDEWDFYPKGGKGKFEYNIKTKHYEEIVVEQNETRIWYD